MRLENPKWEVFAQARADGMNQIDAYEHAGYPRSPSAASQLNNRPEVLDRIQEIAVEKAEQRRAETEGEFDDLPEDLTREWLLKTLMKNVAIAQRAGQIAPANKAVEMIAEMIGISFKNKTANVGDNTIETTPANREPAFDFDRAAEAFKHLANVLPSEKDRAPATPPPAQQEEPSDE